MGNYNHKEKESRLMAVISAISRHYFDQYDLTDSLRFWDMLDRKLFKDRLLRIILWIYRSPYIKIMTIIGLGVLILLSLFPGDTFVHRSLFLLLILMISVIFFILIYVGGFIINRFREKRAIPYIELLFHPLLVANLVGLTIISISGDSWEIGNKISIIPWVILCSFLYIMPFIYIYTDVYKVLRLKQVSSTGEQSKEKKSIMRRSIDVSFQLFCVQVFQSLVFSSFASFLLAQSILSHEKICCLLHRGIGIRLNLFSFDLYLFPKLIVLWTGLILFIGAFVQLFWQSKDRSS